MTMHPNPEQLRAAEKCVKHAKLKGLLHAALNTGAADPLIKDVASLPADREAKARREGGEKVAERLRKRLNSWASKDGTEFDIEKECRQALKDF